MHAGVSGNILEQNDVVRGLIRVIVAIRFRHAVLLIPLLFFMGAAGAAPPLAGDVDRSGVVDNADLESLVQSILGGVPSDTSDLDLSGALDAIDYQLVNIR